MAVLAVIIAIILCIFVEDARDNANTAPAEVEITTSSMVEGKVIIWGWGIIVEEPVFVDDPDPPPQKQLSGLMRIKFHASQGTETKTALVAPTMVSNEMPWNWKIGDKIHLIEFRESSTTEKSPIPIYFVIGWKKQEK